MQESLASPISLPVDNNRYNLVDLQRMLAGAALSPASVRSRLSRFQFGVIAASARRSALCARKPPDRLLGCNQFAPFGNS